MRIIFMGTPDFAVPCLQRLIDSSNEVVAVYTQPDKPVGRKQVMTAPPVKGLAVQYNIPVFQPTTFKDGEAAEAIAAFNADLIVVVAYGKILPEAVLNAAKYGCINVHASLLPKYRGAAPIQWSILNGDKETGVTIMQMDKGLDTGDILSTVKTDIDINETAEELFDRLSVIGADELINVINKLGTDEINPKKQDESKATYVTKITRELCPIDWSKSALEIHNQVRGLQTWPSASTTIDGKTLKIHKTVLTDIKGNKSAQVVDNKNKIVVCCGDGNCLEITELQLEGKKRMSAASFLQGYKIPSGALLGD